MTLYREADGGRVGQRDPSYFQLSQETPALIAGIYGVFPNEKVSHWLQWICKGAYSQYSNMQAVKSSVIQVNLIIRPHLIIKYKM